MGNTWVYSATYTGFGFNRETNPATTEALTATYIITDQVVATRTYGSLFGAEIQRTASLIRGTSFAKFHNLDFNKEFENPIMKTYSYIISGIQVYQDNELSFLTETKQKATRAYKIPLAYEFPLADGTEFHCWWYYWYKTTQDCHNVVNWCDYYYYVKEQSVSLNLPAGTFNECYTISHALCGAENSRWFCPNTGIVGSKFLWQGQGSAEYPMSSYEIELISYSLVDR